MYGGDSSPPPAPDYAGMAAAQGAANVEAAKQTAYLSNPNVIGPTGKRTVTYNTTYSLPKPVEPSTPRPEGEGIGARIAQAGWDLNHKKYLEDLAAYNASQVTTPTITEELTPEAQAAFTAQQNVEKALAELGLQATDTVKDIMGKPFQYTGPGVQTGLGDTGQVNTQLNLQGQASGGPAAGQFGMQQGGVNAPDYQTGLGGFRDVSQRGYNAPRLQTGLGRTGNITSGLDTSNLAAMPVNAGTTAQQAIMSRLQPQLERQRSQLQTQLANQGITPGSAAYENAMREQSQSENDLLSQAALQGINLDMTARQQGLGEAQTTAGFANLAQQQAYNQALASGQYGNQAQLAQFGANIQGQQAQNAAQQQAFNQALASGQFGNEAQQAAFQSALANQQAQNQAAAANFAQAQAAAQMGNQALSQNQQNQMAQFQAQNAAQNQKYNQALQAAQFANTADAQEFQRQLGLYNLPLNQVSALMSGSQVQMPQFQPYQVAGVTAAPIFQAGQAQYQSALDAYNASVASANAQQQGILGVGMMAATAY